MANVIVNELKEKLTPRQRAAWQMRYVYRWRVKRIALEMGIKHNSVTELLQRAQRRAGLSRPIRISVIRAKPRFAATQSLSTAINY